jgi:hypothetical protein
MNADELRAAVLRFHLVHKMLAEGSPEKHRLSILRTVRRNGVRGAALIPGSSLLVRVLSSGSVELVSIGDHTPVASWSSGTSLLLPVALTICTSRQYGVMVLADVEYGE